jgi:hypothetical protein
MNGGVQLLMTHALEPATATMIAAAAIQNVNPGPALCLVGVAAISGDWAGMATVGWVSGLAGRVGSASKAVIGVPGASP